MYNLPEDAALNRTGVRALPRREQDYSDGERTTTARTLAGTPPSCFPHPNRTHGPRRRTGKAYMIRHYYLQQVSHGGKFAKSLSALPGAYPRSRQDNNDTHPVSGLRLP